MICLGCGNPMQGDAYLAITLTRNGFNVETGPVAEPERRDAIVGGVACLAKWAESWEAAYHVTQTVH